MIHDNFITNLEYYKVFYYVAKHKNITIAADRLSLTQPSVTKSIQRLEEQLGCLLFVRTKRGVTLTAEGMVLWKRIEPACELIRAAEHEVEAIKSLNSGTINIASTEMGFTAYVLPALQLFAKDYPNIKVRFRNALTGEALEMLKTGVIDLAVLIPPADPDETMDFKTIDIFEECLIVGPRYAFLAGQENELADLAQYPFISMPEGSTGKAYMIQCFQQHGLSFEPDVEVTTMELVVQATAANFGIGTLPGQIVETRIRDGTIFRVPLKEKLPHRKVLAITNRAVQLNRATQVFLEHYLGAV